MDSILNNSQEYIDLVTQHGISYGLQILIALAVFLIGKRVARIVTNTVTRAMESKEIDPQLISFIGSLLYSGLFILVCIVALTQLGLQTASFIAVLGAAGLAIGLALQGSLSNFAAGILIIILKPFKSGDFVDIAGESGVVMDIKIFTTELRTGDNKCVIIPNARVLNSNIVNHSSTGSRRVDLVFGIGYEDDIDHARKTIEQVLSEESRILKDPEPVVAVSALADNSVNIIVRPWVNTADYWSVNRSLLEQIKKRFDQEGISIPFPQRTVHLVGQANQ
ncbi:MAG: mechanosensitive ion channel [Gammaproteobacteria bacterium]|nr:mechanosensitive ion channel [Gammaproteobacteria bacterium]